MDNPIEAWHFIGADGRLAYPHNGKRLKVEPGLKLHVTPPLYMCARGLHGSVRALDALGHAPKDTKYVCRCVLSGEMVKDANKICAEYREVLWIADCERTLHEFGIWCAEKALQLLKDPDPRSLAAIEIKKRWLAGKASDEELAAAEESAWAAVRPVRMTAITTIWLARAAARAASTIADAAIEVSHIAQGAAISTADTRDITRNAQNEKLEEMLFQLEHLKQPKEKP